MSATQPSYQTAEEARRLNQDLDRQLLELARSITPGELAASGDDEEWGLAQNLGHIAEFPGYFARQLDAWLRSEQVVIGRVAEHSAARNDAVVQAERRSLDEHVATMEASFAELAGVLEGLGDEHLETVTVNVKYGEEPLRAYLDRYVIGHKAAHVEQLRAAIDRVRASR